MAAPESIAGVCDVRTIRGEKAGPDRAPDLLIEVPHGATRARHFETLRARLRGRLPADLIAFFHVNTDSGAPELATAVAERLVAEEPARSVLIVTSEIPRTFIDCNRVVDSSPAEFRAGKVTPGLPPYVRDVDDRRLLRELHERYVAVCRAAYETVCAPGGIAMMAHSYAPRSVDVEVDDDIVASLRRAYAPEVEPTWPMRPQIDIIAKDPTGRIVSEPIARRLEAAFQGAGFETALGTTYPLHPSTQAFHHVERWKPRAVCFEVRRDLLVDTFVPFVEMATAPEKVARVAAPLVSAVRDTW